MSLSEVHRITPQLFNEARFGFVRSANITIGAADGFGGAEPIPLNAAGDATLPGIDIFSLPFAESPSPPELQNNNLFSFNDDVTYVHGQNTFKSGFWVRRVQDNLNLQPLSSGVYFFNTVADLVNNNPAFVLQSSRGNRFRRAIHQFRFLRPGRRPDHAPAEAQPRPAI